MKTIRQFHFPLDREQVLFAFSKDDQILSVQAEDKHAVLNVLIENNVPAVTLLETPEQMFTRPDYRRLWILRTGQHIYEWQSLRFIGTVQPADEPEAYHIFEEVPK